MYYHLKNSLIPLKNINEQKYGILIDPSSEMINENTKNRKEKMVRTIFHKKNIPICFKTY